MSSIAYAASGPPLTVRLANFALALVAGALLGWLIATALQSTWNYQAAPGWSPASFAFGPLSIAVMMAIGLVVSIKLNGRPLLSYHDTSHYNYVGFGALALTAGMVMLAH